MELNHPRNIWRTLAFVLVAGSILSVAYWAIRPATAPAWTGFGPYAEAVQGPRSKTLWDWLDLLIVPITLSLGAWWLDRSEKYADTRRELDRQRQTILDEYLGFMTELLTKEDFITAGEINPRYYSVVRTRTMVALKNLDGDRKGSLLQFLYEGGLITKPAKLQLTGADLTEAHLENATLGGSELRGVHFNGAILRNANLTNADVSGSDFTGADLTNIHVPEAVLNFAVCKVAKVINVDMRRANITFVDFTGARLDESQLTQEQIQDPSLTLDPKLAKNLKLKGVKDE